MDNGVCPYCGHKAGPGEGSSDSFNRAEGSGAFGGQNFFNGQQMNGGQNFNQGMNGNQNFNQGMNGMPYPNQEIHIYNQVAVSQKNKWVAFILCFFLGYLGIHYFYVGKIGMGILYLLTGGLFGIGWIVDIIRILVGSFRDGAGLPVRA